MDVAIGPYKGKETGEPALLRSMLDSLDEGDIAVMDRYYCSFMMISLLLSQGVQTCARKHHVRHTDFRRGKRLEKNDHIKEYTKEKIAELYGFRWNSELDIRSIKESLNLGHVRCKSPEEEGYCLKLLKQIAECEVANRPGQLEPRVVNEGRSPTS